MIVFWIAASDREIYNNDITRLKKEKTPVAVLIYVMCDKIRTRMFFFYIASPDKIYCTYNDFFFINLKVIYCIFPLTFYFVGHIKIVIVTVKITVQLQFNSGVILPRTPRKDCCSRDVSLGNPRKVAPNTLWSLISLWRRSNRNVPSPFHL